MKKTITLITTLLIMFSAQAQGLEALFDRAIRNGRSNNGKGSYSASFDNKNVPVDDVLLFMGKKGYILTEKYSTRRMMRFGSYVNAMGKVDFILESDLESFIANTRKTSTMGKAVIYPNSRKEIAEVYWSGSVKNGWISGNGTGYTKLNNNMYIIKGDFIDGIPEGTCEVVTATTTIVSGTVSRLDKIDRKNTNYYVGDFNNGYRSLCMNEKYGFINEKGDIVVSCKYGKIVQVFNSDGYAIVTDPSDDDQEIKINTYGTKLGYSDRQLQINEEKRLAQIEEEKRLAEERKRNEEERIRRARERAEAEARADALRQERIRNAREGDRICYCQEYYWSEGFWIFKESGSYKMNVICFVEKNVDNGDRLQIRVGSVESTSDDRYTTPEINGIKYRKGDVLWIRPLQDKNWKICEY